jgi:Cu2+-exporting ATPase
MQSDAENRCFHCDLKVPDRQHYHLEVLNKTQSFCCPGCLYAAENIISSGLSHYYRERTSHSPTASSDNLLSDSECAFFDEQENQNAFSAQSSGNERSTLLSIDGMQCAACSWLIKNRVQEMEGVTAIHVNTGSHQARLSWRPEIIPLSRILNQLNALGYQAQPLWHRSANDEADRVQKIALKRLGVSGLGMMQVMMLSVGLYAGAFSGIEDIYESLLRWVSLLVSSAVLIYSGSPFFISALKGLRNAHLNMDLPISLALAGAYISSIWATLIGGGEVYFDSVTMFIFFLTLGRFLEASGRYRANRTAQALLKCLPETAIRILSSGEDELVTVHSLNSGDHIRVKPGSTIPVDANIIEGTSSVDESLLTGEINPKNKSAGDRVYGGSQNIESPLILEVTNHVQHSLLSNIMQLMERGLEEKPRIALLADKVARYFVLTLLLIATGVFTTWWFIEPERALWITISILVITCPCALSLATPVALTAASNALMKNGVLLTRSNVLEKIIKADTVVFDKTGTLTQGKFALKKVWPLSSSSEAESLALATSLESNSEHPISLAFQNISRGSSLRIATQIKNYPNQGIEGLIEGVLYRVGKADFASALYSSHRVAYPSENTLNSAQRIFLASELGPVACFDIEDPLRQEVPGVLRTLKSQGLSLVMLSGDPSPSAKELARSLKFDSTHIDFAPAQKMQYVRSQQDLNHHVIMLGDGINDAPVLAQADVSFAMSNGTALAKSSADVVLLKEDLELVVTTKDMAKKTLRVIRQNMAWAIAYNGIALPLAAFGFIEPYMAVIGMSASSLVVVLNSLRLR